MEFREGADSGKAAYEADWSVPFVNGEPHVGTLGRLMVSNRFKMIYVRKTVFLLIALFVLVLVIGETNHFHRYGHLASPGLHADIVARRGDIGVKGVSTLYSARLTNYGFLPRKVLACDFATGTSYKGTVAAYDVDLWDNRLESWSPIWEDQKDYFCIQKIHDAEPYPLGNTQAHLSTRRLWPGQSISTDEEATAARSGLERGDAMRFEVFAGEAGDLSTTYSTAPFRIDEAPGIESGSPRIRPIRVSH